MSDDAQASLSGVFAPATTATGRLPLPDFDPASYLSELDDMEITPDQKLALLATVWSIMRSFVELGFDVNLCGQILDGLANSGDQNSSGVKSGAGQQTPESETGYD